MKLAILLAIFARVGGDERRELAGPAPGKETYDPRLATLRAGRAGGSSSRAVTPPDVTRSLSRDREGAHTIATASTPRAATHQTPEDRLRRFRAPAGRTSHPRLRGMQEQQRRRLPPKPAQKRAQKPAQKPAPNEPCREREHDPIGLTMSELHVDPNIWHAMLRNATTRPDDAALRRVARELDQRDLLIVVMGGSVTLGVSCETREGRGSASIAHAAGFAAGLSCRGTCPKHSEVTRARGRRSCRCCCAHCSRRGGTS